ALDRALGGRAGRRRSRNRPPGASGGDRAAGAAGALAPGDPARLPVRSGRAARPLRQPDPPGAARAPGTHRPRSAAARAGRRPAGRGGSGGRGGLARAFHERRDPPGAGEPDLHRPARRRAVRRGDRRDPPRLRRVRAEAARRGAAHRRAAGPAGPFDIGERSMTVHKAMLLALLIGAGGAAAGAGRGPGEDAAVVEDLELAAIEGGVEFTVRTRGPVRYTYF